MLKITPNDAILGAKIEEFDAAQPMDDAVFQQILAALGRHGVLRFPRQTLTPAEFVAGGTIGPAPPARHR